MKFFNKGRHIDLDYSTRLQEIRKQHGLKRTEAAEMLGINYQHYTRAERGEMKLSQEVLVRFATLFEVDYIWLITGYVQKPV